MCRAQRAGRGVCLLLCLPVCAGAHDELLASFPFPHLLEVAVELSDRTLTVSTTVTPTTDTAVPLAYGYHPYLQLPDVPRAQWQVEMPAMRHLMLDDTGIPTGATAESPAVAEPLGAKLFDDGCVDFRHAMTKQVAP